MNEEQLITIWEQLSPENRLPAIIKAEFPDAKINEVRTQLIEKYTKVELFKKVGIDPDKQPTPKFGKLEALVTKISEASKTNPTRLNALGDKLEELTVLVRGIDAE